MEKKGLVHYFCGDGKGKTGAAIGQGIKAVGKGLSVVVIQFLKGKDTGEYDVLKSLEPQMKLFSFEKSEQSFEELSEEEKEHELLNIRNGINYARKVLSTGECDVLILDEFLGLVDTSIISAEEFKGIIDSKPEDTTVIITGIKADAQIRGLADQITTLSTTFTK